MNNVRSGEEQIKNGINKTADKASGLVSTIKDEFSNAADSVKKNGQEVLHQTEEIAQKAYNQVTETGSEVMKRVEKEIKSSPLTAMAIAFGAGAVCAMLFGKSSSQS